MTTIYDNIGKGYNTTRQADKYILGRINTLLHPKKRRQYLDIGCGTGNYTKKIASPDYHFWAVDPSITMLEQSNKEEGMITWLRDYAETFSLPEGVKVDGCIAINTIHHWKDMEQGFKNISDKLEKGARFLIFTQLPEQMNHYWVKHYFPKMIEKSIVNRPSEAKIAQLLVNAGFKHTYSEKYFVNKKLKDLFVNASKHNPAIYLQEEVRKGMSIFALFCSPEEETDGLNRLKEDIGSGKVQEIIDSYNSDLGDYYFMLAVKE